METKNNEQTPIVQDEQKEVKTETNPASEISKLMSEYKEQATVTDEKTTEKKQRGRPKKTEGEPDNKIKENTFISGALFLLLINLIIPALIAFLHNSFNKKNKIKSSKLQLTKQQLEDMNPLADEAAKQLMLKLNPITLFVMAMIGAYGINYMMMIDVNDK